MVVYTVIMAGGKGTRLWPMSRSSNPKQLIKLVDNQSLFQKTLERIKPLSEPRNTIIVAGENLVPKLLEQAQGIPSQNFIVEPEGKGTAPCIGLAAIHVLHRDPEGIMAVLPADHYISDVSGFHRAMRSSFMAAERGHLVTLSISPTHPSTGYGYIKQGNVLYEFEGMRVYRVERFVEKPDEKAAARMLLEGGYSWNSGMFVWKAERIMEEFSKHTPILNSSLAEISIDIGKASYESVLRKSWTKVPTETIDYGVMEKAEDVAVIPSNMGWSDIGSWSSLKELLAEDENLNTSRGNNVLVQTSGSMIFGEKRLIAAIGLKDILIVDTDDALLVCQLKDDQKVKDVVNALKTEKKLNYL